MKLYFSNTIKRLLSDKKNSCAKLVMAAVAVMIPVLFSALVVSFAGQSFLELESISVFLHLYTTDTTNSIYKLCNVVSITALVVSVVIMVAMLLLSTLNKRTQIKNNLVMGASYGQAVGVVVIENLMIYVVGFVVGAIVGCLGALIIGGIYSVKTVIPFEILLIEFLLNLGLVLVVSILVPLWISTSQIKRK